MSNSENKLYVNLGIFVFCCVVIMIAVGGILFQTNKKLIEETPREVVKEVIYLEIPCFVDRESEEDLATEEDLFLDYFDLKTDDNIEYWWYGYNLMVDTLTVKPLRITDVFTEEELMYFYRCVETEVCGADFRSKVNVASVILNRLYSDRFPDDLITVITSPSQFAYSRTNITESTVAACAYAFEIEDTTDGALFFHSGDFSETFNSATYIFTDSVGHHFYK